MCDDILRSGSQWFWKPQKFIWRYAIMVRGTQPPKMVDRLWWNIMLEIAKNLAWCATYNASQFLSPKECISKGNINPALCFFLNGFKIMIFGNVFLVSSKLQKCWFLVFFEEVNHFTYTFSCTIFPFLEHCLCVYVRSSRSWKLGEIQCHTPLYYLVLGSIISVFIPLGIWRSISGGFIQFSRWSVWNFWDWVFHRFEVLYI